MYLWSVGIHGFLTESKNADVQRAMTNGSPETVTNQSWDQRGAFSREKILAQTVLSR